MSKKLVTWLLLLLFIVPIYSYAADRVCGGKKDMNAKVVVLYVNGIWNTKEDETKCSSDKLWEFVVRNGLERNYIGHDYLYNEKKGYWSDLRELYGQAEISNLAFSRVNGMGEGSSSNIRLAYYRELGRVYTERVYDNREWTEEKKEQVFFPVKDLAEYLRNKTEGGQSIVVVAHSQGNFIIEAAYAMLYYAELRKYPSDTERNSPVLSHVRVVSIAPVSASTPDNRWVSLSRDGALKTHRQNTANLQYFKVLANNAVVYDSPPPLTEQRIVPSDYSDANTFLGHEFVEQYLSDQQLLGEKRSISQKVMMHIKNALEDFEKGIEPPVRLGKSGVKTIFDEPLLCCNTAGAFKGVVVGKIPTTSSPVPTNSNSTKATLPAKSENTARVIFSGSTVGVEGVPVEFSGGTTRSNDPTSSFSYYWDFGDGQYRNDGKSGFVIMFVPHTYERPGEYIVTLTVTSGVGVKSSCKLVITVENIRTKPDRKKDCE